MPEARFRSILALSIALLLIGATVCFAQPQSISPGTAAASTTAPAAQKDQSKIVVPVGTKIPLVLTDVVVTKTAKPGDEVYTQVVSPVLSGDQVAIPGGTIVQGKIAKWDRKGSRAILCLQSLSVIFSNGYVVKLAAPLKLESAEGYALQDLSGGRKAGAIAATTVAGPAGLLALFGAHDFRLEVGAPLDLVLEQAIPLEKDRVAEAVPQAKYLRVQRVMPAYDSRTETCTTDEKCVCKPGLERCMGQCLSHIWFTDDDNNCGSCGNRCWSDQKCVTGTCMKKDKP